MRFREVCFYEWATAIAVIAFVVSMAIFLFFLVGALRTSRARLDHDAAMPLQEDDLS